MKTYIQLICIALIVTINYSCKKKVPIIEHSISGVLYLDHTMQPAANYELQLQYNSLAYSLRDTKILDKCVTDENGRYYLKYVKIVGGGELEIENSGGTALLTEIPVNEDINFSFPIQPYTNVEYKFNYSRPLAKGDSVFIYAESWLEKKTDVNIYLLDTIGYHYLMLTELYQPEFFSFNYGFSELNYKELIEVENSIITCPSPSIFPIGFGIQNTIKNHKQRTTLNSFNYEPDSTYYSFCLIEEYIDPFNATSTININLPD